MNFKMINVKTVNFVLAIYQLKVNPLTFKCLKCDKTYEKQFNKNLINRSANTYQFCD